MCFTMLSSETGGNESPFYCSAFYSLPNILGHPFRKKRLRERWGGGGWGGGLPLRYVHFSPKPNLVLTHYKFNLPNEVYSHPLRFGLL